MHEKMTKATENITPTPSRVIGKSSLSTPTSKSVGFQPTIKNRLCTNVNIVQQECKECRCFVLADEATSYSIYGLAYTPTSPDPCGVVGYAAPLCGPRGTGRNNQEYAQGYTERSRAQYGCPALEQNFLRRELTMRLDSIYLFLLLRIYVNELTENGTI